MNQENQMTKMMFAFGVGMMMLSGAGHAAPVYYYDTLKIKAVLDSPEVEARFRAQRLPNGGSAVSLEGVQMRAVDPARNRILFEVKSSGCALPVVVSFDPLDPSPQYQVTNVGEWHCQ